MINIRYAEYDTSNPNNFVVDIPKGDDCWFLLFTQTPMVFLVNDELREYPAHCAVLFQPNQKICYRINSEKYAVDWIGFDTDEIYVTQTPMIYGVPFVIHDPAYCHKLFQLLVTEYVSNNNYKEITIDCLLRILFHKMLESYNDKQESPLYRGLHALKKEIYRNPGREWNVTEMAEKLNISVGYLEDAYKKTFGVSCMDDVIYSRIDLAKKYLLYDQYTIAEIVTLCGYRNIEHFFRQFKKNTGVTPGYYRKLPHGSCKSEGVKKNKTIKNGKKICKNDS
jgi:AraC-like DNA-binding protein